jgi:hypothetical protein
MVAIRLILIPGDGILAVESCTAWEFTFPLRPFCVPGGLCLCSFWGTCMTLYICHV